MKKHWPLFVLVSLCAIFAVGLVSAWDQKSVLVEHSAEVIKTLTWVVGVAGAALVGLFVVALHFGRQYVVLVVKTLNDQIGTLKNSIDKLAGVVHEQNEAIKIVDRECARKHEESNKRVNAIDKQLSNLQMRCNLEHGNVGDFGHGQK